MGTVVPAKFLVRRDTVDNWTYNNPTLSVGEIGFELPTSANPSGKMKIGNGERWNDIQYIAQGESNISITNVLTNNDTSINFNVNGRLLQEGSVANIFDITDSENLVLNITLGRSPGGIYTVTLPSSVYFTYDHKYRLTAIDSDGVTSISTDFIYNQDSGVTSFIPEFNVQSHLYIISSESLGISYTYKGPNLNAKYIITDSEDDIIDEGSFSINRSLSLQTFTTQYTDLTPSTLTAGLSYKIRMYREDITPNLQILESPPTASGVEYQPFTLNSITFIDSDRFRVLISNPTKATIKRIELIEEGNATPVFLREEDSITLSASNEYSLNVGAVFETLEYKFKVTFIDDNDVEISAENIRTIDLSQVTILDNNTIRPTLTLTGVFKSTIDVYEGGTTSGTIVSTVTLQSDDTDKFTNAADTQIFVFKNTSDIEFPSNIFKYGTVYSFKITDFDVASINDESTSVSAGSITSTTNQPFSAIIPTKNETTEISLNYKWTGPAYTGVYAECISYDDEGNLLGPVSLANPIDAAEPTRQIVTLPTSGSTSSITLTTSQSFVLGYKYLIRVSFPDGGSTVESSEVEQENETLVFVRFEGQKFIRLKQLTGTSQDIILQIKNGSGTFETIGSPLTQSDTSASSDGVIVQFMNSGDPYLFEYDRTYRLRIASININSVNELQYLMNSTGPFLPTLSINNSGTDIIPSFTGGGFQTAAYTMTRNDFNRSDPRILLTIQDVTLPESPTPVSLFTDIPYAIGTPIQPTSISVGTPVAGSIPITYTFSPSHSFLNDEVVQFYNGTPDQYNIKGIVNVVSSTQIRLSTTDTRFSSGSQAVINQPFVVKINNPEIEDASPKDVTDVSYVAPGGGIAYHRFLIETSTNHGYTAGTYVKITGVSNEDTSLNIPIQGSVITNTSDTFYIAFSDKELVNPSSITYSLSSAKSSIIINPVDRKYSLYAYHTTKESPEISKSVPFSLYSTLFLNAKCEFTNQNDAINSTMNRKYNLTNYTIKLQERPSGGSTWSDVSTTITRGTTPTASTLDYQAATNVDTFRLISPNYFKKNNSYRAVYGLTDPTGNPTPIEYVSDILTNTSTITNPTITTPAPDVTGLRINLSFDYVGGPTRMHVKLRPPSGSDITISDFLQVPNTLTTTRLSFNNLLLNTRLTGAVEYSLIFNFDTPSGVETSFSNVFTYTPTACTITWSGINAATEQLTYQFVWSGPFISSSFGNLTFRNQTTGQTISGISITNVPYTAASGSSYTRTITIPTGVLAVNNTYRLTVSLPDSSRPVPFADFSYVSITASSPTFVFSDIEDGERGIGRFTATLNIATNSRQYELREFIGDTNSRYSSGSNAPEVRYSSSSSTANDNSPVNIIIPSRYLRYDKYYQLSYRFVSVLGGVTEGSVNSVQYRPVGYDILVFAGQSNMAGRDNGLQTDYGFINSAGTKRFYENTLTTEIPFNTNINYSDDEKTDSLTHIGVTTSPTGSGAAVPNVCHVEEVLSKEDPAAFETVALRSYNASTNEIEFITEHTLSTNSQIYFNDNLGSIINNSFYFMKNTDSPGRVDNYKLHRTELALNSPESPRIDLTGSVSNITSLVNLQDIIDMSSGSGVRVFRVTTRITDSYTDAFLDDLVGKPVILSTTRGINGITSTNPAYIQSYSRPVGSNIVNFTIRYKNVITKIGPTDFPGTPSMTVYRILGRISTSSIVHGTTSNDFKSAVDTVDVGVTLAYDFTKLYSQHRVGGNPLFDSNRRICTVFRPLGGSSIIRNPQWENTSPDNLRKGLINQIKNVQRTSVFVNTPGSPNVPITSSYSRHRVVMFGWLQGEADASFTMTPSNNWTDRLRNIISDVFDETDTTYDDVRVVIGNIELTHHQRVIDDINYSAPGVGNGTTATQLRASNIIKFLKTIDRFRDDFIAPNLRRSIIKNTTDQLSYKVYGVSSTGLYSIDPYTPGKDFESYSVKTSVHYSARAERVLGLRFFNAYLALSGFTGIQNLFMATDSTPQTYAYNTTTGVLAIPSNTRSYDFQVNPVGCFLTAVNNTQSAGASNLNRYAVIPEHSGQGIITENQFDLNGVNKAYLPYFSWLDSALYDNNRAHTRSGVRETDIEVISNADIFSGSTDTATVQFLPTRPTYINNTGGGISAQPDPTATAKLLDAKLLNTNLRSFLQTITEDITPIWNSNDTDEILMYNRIMLYDNTRSIDVPSRYNLRSVSQYICPVTSVFSNKIASYLDSIRTVSPPQVLDPFLYRISDSRASTRSSNTVDILRHNLSATANQNAGLIMAGVFPNTNVSNYYPPSGGTGGTATPGAGFSQAPVSIGITTAVGTTTQYRRFGNELNTRLFALPRTNANYTPGTHTVQGTGCIVNRVIANQFDSTTFYSEGQYNTQSLLPVVEWPPPSGSTTPIRANRTNIVSLDNGSQYAGITREGSAETDPVGTALSSTLKYTNSDFHYFYMYNTGSACIFKLKNFLPNKTYKISYYISTKANIVPGDTNTNITSVTGGTNSNIPYLTNSLPVKVYTTDPSLNSGINTYSNIILTRIIPPIDTNPRFPYRIRIKVSGNDVPQINNMLSFDRRFDQIADNFGDTLDVRILGEQGGQGGMYFNKPYYIRTIYPVAGDSTSYDISISEFPTAGPASQAQNIGAGTGGDTSAETVTFPLYTSVTDFPLYTTLDDFPITGQLYTGSYGTSGYAKIVGVDATANTITVEVPSTEPDMIAGQRIRVLRTDNNGGLNNIISTAIYFIRSDPQVVSGAPAGYKRFSFTIAANPTAATAHDITGTFDTARTFFIYFTQHCVNSDVDKTTYSASTAETNPNTISISGLNTLNYGPPYIGQPVRLFRPIGSDAGALGTFFIESIADLTNSGNSYTFRFRIAGSIRRVEANSSILLNTPGVTDLRVQFLYPMLDYTRNPEFLRFGTSNSDSITDYTAEQQLFFKNGTDFQMSNTQIQQRYLHGVSGRWNGSWKKMEFTFSTPDYESQSVGHAGYLQFGPLPSVRNLPNRYVKIITISSTNENSILVTTDRPHGLKSGDRIARLTGITTPFNMFNITNQKVTFTGVTTVATQFRIARADPFPPTPPNDLISNPGNPDAPNSVGTDYSNENAFIVIPMEFDVTTPTNADTNGDLNLVTALQNNVKVNDVVEISGINLFADKPLEPHKATVISVAANKTSFIVRGYRYADSRTRISNMKAKVMYSIEIASLYSLAPDATGSELFINTTSAHGLKVGDIVSGIRGLTARQTTTISSVSSSNTFVVNTIAGLSIGTLIYISGNSVAANNGSYLISSISGTTVTVTNVQGGSVTFTSTTTTNGVVSVDTSQFNTENMINVSSVPTATRFSVKFPSLSNGDLSPIKTRVATLTSPITFTAPFPLVVFDTNPTPTQQELEFINTSINIGGIEIAQLGNEDYSDKVETINLSSTVA